MEAQPLPDAIAKQEAGIIDRDLGVRARQERAIHIDQDAFVSRIEFRFVRLLAGVRLHPSSPTCVLFDSYRSFVFRPTKPFAEEPSAQSSRMPIGERRQNENVRGKMVPDEGIEPPTFGLQNRCSTAELIRRFLIIAHP